MDLIKEWSAAGFLVTSRRQHATRVLGSCPDDKADEQAYLLWYYNVGASNPRSEATAEKLADRDRMPDTLRNGFRKKGAPTPKECRDRIGRDFD